MQALVSEKKRAVALRMSGYTYSEILREVRVSQSTLSLWLRDIRLTSTQLARINKKKKQSVRLGGKVRHQICVKRNQSIINAAAEEIHGISNREIWLIGVALYWAEGSKQRAKTLSQGVVFSNSDPDMIRIFYLWLTKIVGIAVNDISFEIYINQSIFDEKDRISAFWAGQLELSSTKFGKIYLKKNATARQYPRNRYNGLLRIVVKKSTLLNRKIQGWQWGIVEELRDRLMVGHSSLEAGI